jgi:hypothetical protein
VLGRAAIRDYARTIRSSHVSDGVRTTITLRLWAEPDKVLAALSTLPGLVRPVWHTESADGGAVTVLRRPS